MGMDWLRLPEGLREEAQRRKERMKEAASLLRELFAPKPLPKPKASKRSFTAADGSYAREEGLLACWAVTVSTGERGQEAWKGLWLALEPEEGEEAVGRALAAFTLGMEVLALGEAKGRPLFDGSLATPFIYLNQAWRVLKGLRLWDTGRDEAVVFPLEAFFEAYESLIRNGIAVPKRTTGGVLFRYLEGKGIPLEGLRNLGDKPLMRLVLERGEWAGPISLGERYHLNHEDLKEVAGGVAALLEKVEVYYLRTRTGEVMRLEGIGLTPEGLAELEELSVRGEPLPLGRAHELASRLPQYLGFLTRELWWD